MVFTKNCQIQKLISANTTRQVFNRVNGKLNQMSENRLADYKSRFNLFALISSLIVFTSNITLMFRFI